jgi:hypothetical protein
MIRRLGAVLAVAVPPWALACLLTVAMYGHNRNAARQVLHTLFLTPEALSPLVVFVVCFIVIVIFERGKFFSAGQHWVVGGFLALAATVTVAVLAAAWGGEYVFYWTLPWLVYSGYWAFVWLAGAYAWRLLTVARPEWTRFQAREDSR